MASSISIAGNSSLSLSHGNFQWNQQSIRTRTRTLNFSRSWTRTRKFVRIWNFFRPRTQTRKLKCFKPRILTRTRTLTFEQITELDMSMDTPRTISKIEKKKMYSRPTQFWKSVVVENSYRSFWSKNLYSSLKDF